MTTAGSTILRRFAASHERRSLAGDAGWCRTVADFSEACFGKDVARIGAANLEQILFEVFPQEVICSPSEARPIIRELRAFFTFLKRSQGAKTADACLEVLNASTARELERRLADPVNFGVAKLFFLSARPLAASIDGPRQVAR